MTSHVFTPPPSEFGRDVIISYHERSFGLIVMSGARLGIASERISHGWVNGSSSERVGIRHEFEFRQLLAFSRQPIQSSLIRMNRIYPVSAKKESSIPVQSSAVLGFWRRKTSSVGLVKSESFSRSLSGVVIGIDMLVVSRASIGRWINDDWTTWPYIWTLWSGRAQLVSTKVGTSERNNCKRGLHLICIN